MSNCSALTYLALSLPKLNRTPKIYFPCKHQRYAHKGQGGAGWKYKARKAVRIPKETFFDDGFALITGTDSRTARSR